jgi:microcin C transport system permease protein
MDRLAYLIKRMLLVIPTFIGITLVCFSLTRFLPGGPVELRMMRAKGMTASVQGSSAPASAANSVSDEYRKELEAQFGFDKPVYVQYWDWLVVNRMGLNLPSYDYPDKTAWQLIKSRIPVSLWFGIASFLLTYLVCIPLGIVKALRHRQAFDAVSSVIVFAAYAIPSFAFSVSRSIVQSGCRFFNLAISLSQK